MIISNASGNTIGGTAAGAANVISGNTNDGVEITGAGASSNVVEGDHIGVDVTGTHAIANHVGVEIDGGATGNTIGTNGDGVNDAAERDIISGNLFAGVWMTGAGTDHNVVAGDFIGTTVAGDACAGNGSAVQYDSFGAELAGGVVIDRGASDNLIGTSGQAVDDAGQRNIISGSQSDGVEIEHAGTSGNVVAGNYIGTNPAGTAAVANQGQAILIAEVNAVNYVGVNPVYGPAHGDEGNLISGNLYDATQFYDATAGVVAGNLMGTDVTGSVAIPNYDGIEFVASSNILAGTSGQDGAATDALERNVISGNQHFGMAVWAYTGSGLTGVPTSGNVVAGNLIGTNAAGTAALGNGGPGVWLLGGPEGNWIGVNPVYGPENADQRNVIAGAGSYGVRIQDAGTTGNVVAGNLIGLDVDAQGHVINGLGGGFASVAVTGGAANNWIGVNAAAGAGTESALQRNVIAGSYIGVAIYNSGTTGNVVAGNFIGTDPTGTAAVPNQGFDAPQTWGVVIAVGASSNLIGTSGQDGSAADTLERNIISGNNKAAVYIYGQGYTTTGNVVAGDFIGTTATGNAALANGYGVLVCLGATDNWIGANPVYGPEDADQGDVVSGNTNYGVWFENAGTSGNVVAGDLIGTNAAGSAVVGNYVGVEIDSAATGNLVGSDGDGVGDALERDVISGNAFAGVQLTGAGTDNNVVSGDYIGTDVTGTISLGNSYQTLVLTPDYSYGAGVEINGGASDNIIGTTGQTADDVGQRNIISGNSADEAVDIIGSGTAGNVVAGNYIGTNAAGTAASTTATVSSWPSSTRGTGSA